MSGFLTAVRSPVSLGTYGFAFTATRVQSAPSGSGSVFAYHSCDPETPYFFPRREGRAIQVLYKLGFSGCVQEIFEGVDFLGRAATIAVVSLPPTPNITAKALIEKQCAFLGEVAALDSANIETECVVRWGVEGGWRPEPTVVVSLFDRGALGVRSRPATPGDRFSLGDDITFTSYLTRLDRGDQSGQCLMYLLMGSVDNVLRSDQLRVV